MLVGGPFGGAIGGLAGVAMARTPADQFAPRVDAVFGAIDRVANASGAAYRAQVAALETLREGQRTIQDRSPSVVRYPMAQAPFSGPGNRLGQLRAEAASSHQPEGVAKSGKTRGDEVGARLARMPQIVSTSSPRRHVACDGISLSTFEPRSPFLLCTVSVKRASPGPGLPPREGSCDQPPPALPQTSKTGAVPGARHGLCCITSAFEPHGAFWLYVRSRGSHTVGFMPRPQSCAAAVAAAGDDGTALPTVAHPCSKAAAAA